MKKYLIIVFLLSLSNFLFAKNFPSNNQVAIVKKIVKEVQVKKASDSEIESAKIGYSLLDGGQVITKAKSLALLVLTKDKSLLTIRENSILNIYQRKVGNGINTSTNIDKGTVLFKVEKQSADDGFEFVTPSAVASIRGTSGVIDADSIQTNIYLEEGEIFVQSKDDPSKNVTINGGNKLTIDNEGNIEVQEFTDEDKKKIDDTKKINTKKIYITTPYGILEIEYLIE
ncbi:MAG: FecR domain-containing protein [Melioribacteraceae bacterium]|nr:FecR domain-containing protein [Melioribacteraceae bacterium]